MPETTEYPLGHEEGTELSTTTPEGQKVVERVVNDYDEHGNLIGQHKEVVQ